MEPDEKALGIPLAMQAEYLISFLQKSKGYPDDEYFFLKLFDMSRQGYVRNVPSHRFCD